MKIDDPRAYVGPVYVAPAGPRGRGVFAAEPIEAGTLIERCPIIEVPLTEKELIDRTKLYHYYFAWSPDDDGVAICLGYGSLYNHSFTPNATFIRKFDEDVIDFVAVRNIEKGEEIMTNYNGEPEDQEPLPYFEVK